MDEHNPHSQHTLAEDCQLWELAFEYPPLYDALEDLLADASDMSAPETLKGIIKAYQKTEEETFKKIAFERVLNERFGHNVKEILRLLNETHGSTFTPRRVPLGLDFITDERQLELIVLNAKDLEVRISPYTSISSVLDHFPRCCQEKAIDRQKEAFHSF
ncbi:hypothetical protein N9X41_04810 [Porticoccaceae bacterium]|nr:hypothetical protein [Porticoccaceae bacterium]